MYSGGTGLKDELTFDGNNVDLVVDAMGSNQKSRPICQKLTARLECEVQQGGSRTSGLSLIRSPNKISTDQTTVW